MRLLALSGGLRRISTNRTLLNAMAAQADAPLTIQITERIGDLPIFNPDLEGPSTPAPVLAFAREVAEADGLIIASPEYAHGIPGGLKNALDWLVSGAEFPDKPVMIVRATSRGHHAHEALCEVLRTMSARLMPDPVLIIPLLGLSSDAQQELLAREETIASIRNALQDFTNFIATA
jgi:NAD(P)H-dependent FMN reductase